MKKILILFTLVITIMSCSDSNTITITTKNKLNDLTKDSTVSQLIVNGESYSVVRGNDGHDYYLMYIATGAYTGYDRPFHLPSCDLCKRYDKVPSYNK